MADPIIKIKRSGVAGKIPTVDNLQLGELAINTFDGKVYLEKDQSSVGIATTVIVVNPWSVGTGTNTYNTYFDSGSVGIGTTNPTSKLSVVGDGNFTGVVTATTFSGNFIGNISNSNYSTIAGVATNVIGGIASVTSLSVSGISTLDVTSTTSLTSQQLNVSGITTVGFITATNLYVAGVVTATTFIGNLTGTATTASSVSLNSVGLGTNTYGDYVRDITGTSNQITVTGGTGEGSTPTLSIPSQFTVPQDIEVTRDLQVNRNLNVNGNITLGGTTAFINVQELKIFDPDITLGVRTDAFGNDISTDNTANHGGIAIASTEGNPLVQLFIAGIESAPSTYKKIMWFKAGEFAGLGTDAWLMNYAVGIGSTQFPTGTRLAAGSVQFTERDLAVVRNINASGIITASSFSGNASSATYATIAGIATYASSSGIATYATNAGVSTYADNAGIATYATNAGVSTYASSSGIATYATNAGVSTYADNAGITTYATSSGIATYATNAGIATYASTAGIATYATNAGIATYASTAGIATYATNAGVSTSVIGGVSSVTQLQVTGVSTFTNGLVLIGFGTSTGTTSQLLQVTGGAYVSGSVGVGTTNPTSKLSVVGDGNFTGVVTATSFSGSGSNLTGIVTYIEAGSGISIDQNTGKVTITSTGGGGGGSIGLTIKDEDGTVGTAGSITTLNFVGSNISAIASGSISTITVADNLVGTALSISGISTLGVASATNLTVQQLNVSGLSTFSGIVTHTTPLFGTQASFTGVITASSFNGNASSATYATNAGIATYADNAGIATYTTSSGIATYATNAGIATYATNAGVSTYADNAGIATYASTAGVSTSVIGGIGSLTQLQVTGVSTFTNGPVLVGTAISTGTTSQLLQVTGGAYVSGSVGVGTTNPTSKLSVVGDGNFTGVVTATTFFGSLTGTATTATNLANAANITTGTIDDARLPDLITSNINITSGVSTFSTVKATTFEGSLTGNASSATYATTAGIATYATNAGVSTYASSSGIATYASTAGVSTSVIGGIASVTSLSVSGITTLGVVTAVTSINFSNGGVLGDVYADGGIGLKGTANYYAIVASNNLQQFIQVDNNQIFISTGYASTTGTYDWKFDKNGALTFPDSTLQSTAFTGYASTAGIATYATNAGIATYATSSGIATYATSAGVSTYATNAGVSTYAFTAGIATYATNAGVATALQNSRTFEITGDIVASAITFDGTGNVSLAATIQPNSVALGGDTTGDYVQSITGTSNQITVTGGTGESSTPTLSIPSQFTVPQDLKVLRDVQIDRNLNVTGNITLGGTTAFINVQELVVSDPDIVLGYRTDAFGNEISNDNTASHGGIAVASTEGTPLVQLFIAGIETNPATYKKIMWFKAGEFAGLGTDAWLFNYAVGIGSTQFPTGTRLAAGAVQFTERDLAVVRNINASGVVTATTFVGALTGTATSTTNIPNLTGDITSNNTTTTLATVNSNVGTYGDAGAIPSITVNAKGLVTGVTTVAPNNGQLSLAVSGTGLSGSATFTANQSGSSTFTVTSNATDANTSSTIVARDASGNFSAGTITANLTGTATTATNLADAANITTGTINSARLSGTYNINVSYASTAGIATYADNAGIATYASSSGIATYASTAGISTVAQGLTGTPNITVGVVTATSFVKSGGTSSQFLKADGSVDTNTYLTSYTETDTLNSVTGRGNSTANGISVGILTATSGNFSGIVTSSGAVISGATTATSFVKSGGTSSQFLKADGSVDTSTYLTTTGSGTNLTGIVTSIVAGTNVTISGSTGQVTINATGGGGSSGVVIQNQGSIVGTATTINFSTNLTASFSSGTATITATGGGGVTAALDILEVMLFA